MLQNITWGEYWMTVGIIIVLYYLIVMMIYYKDDILQMINRNKKIAHDPGVQENQVPE